MYLRELFIKNSGPLDELQIDFTFTSDDRPIPHVIVGKNGTGKTNLLSIIAAEKPSEVAESVQVIGLQPIPGRRVKRGIENLLRPSAIPDELYKTKTDVTEYGETVTSEELDKAALCDLVCGEDADPSKFSGFRASPSRYSFGAGGFD
jgi:hypothetical protein